MCDWLSHAIKLALLEAQITAEQNQELAALPGQYGFQTLRLLSPQCVPLPALVRAAAVASPALPNPPPRDEKGCARRVVLGYCKFLVGFERLSTAILPKSALYFPKASHPAGRILIPDNDVAYVKSKNHGR